MLREREELITRFFAYGDGLDAYRDKVSPFLFDYAKRMNQVMEANPMLVTQYRDRFSQTMAFVARVFPYGFRRKAGGNDTPRTRFEAIAIGSYFALNDRPSLATQSPDVTEWLGSTDFRDVIGSDGANVTSKLKARLAFVRNKLVGAGT
jgi:hypothetical protein